MRGRHVVTGVIACTADKGADFSKLEHLAAGGDDMVEPTDERA